MFSEMDLAQRVLVILGVIVVMFVVAYAAILLNRFLSERRQIRAMDADTGTKDGASRGQDNTHNEQWFAQVHADRPPDEELNRWQGVILGPGSVHEDPSIQPAPPGHPDAPAQQP